MPIQFTIRHFDEVDSTNKEALRQAALGAAEGLVIVSQHQTAGRGRMGRTWLTMPQSLAMTVLLRPKLVPTEIPKLSLLTAVALHEALKPFASEIGIKWPNDLLIQGKKVSGILTEMRCDRNEVTAAILGIGINLAPPETGWPDEIAQPATDLTSHCTKPVLRDEVLESVLLSIAQWYDRFLTEGFAPVRNAWWQAHIASGKQVRVHDGNDYIHGIAHALAEDGALRLLVNGQEQRIIAGDVSLMDESI